MRLEDAPIQRKLVLVVLCATAVALLLTCAAFFVYEVRSFRATTIRQLEVLGRAIADNSTAALAFKNKADGTEVLGALRANPHIEAGALFDLQGRLFASYPPDLVDDTLPQIIDDSDFVLAGTHISGFVTVEQGGNRLGTLYLRSDLRAINQRLKLYLLITAGVFVGALVVAYALSTPLQRQISFPLLSLAAAARAISEQHDYSVRMPRGGRDEIGVLSQALNQMLKEIEQHVTEANQAAKTISSRNRELESLLYVISHDLREPLRTIQNFSELLDLEHRERQNDEGAHLIKRIRTAANRLEALLLDLLDVSRARRMTCPEVHVPARALVDAAMERIAARVAASEARVSVADDLPELFVDRMWATEAIQNLLTNALKYTCDGEAPEVTITGWRQEEEVGLVVADRGPGVPEELMSKIFELFQRGVGREVEGTGAGLAIVREVAEKHGGRAWVENRDGGGARFVLTFGRASNGSEQTP